MASSGSMTRPLCANHEDMPDKWTDAELDKVKDKDMRTPSCWCGDVCKVKVSTDRKKSWTEGRRYFVCPNYAYDRPRQAHAYDVLPSPPPLCKYFTWIDQDVLEDVKKDQHRDCLRRQRLFEEAFQRGLDEERREKERMEHKKCEEERARKEKIARQEERARKLARAREAQEEDEARDKKGKWPRVTQ
ncbi:hypothetical protein VPH35_054537 [Triticum aestivum]|uniref:GRF-type domain-containing protein n=1 Tax=Triticum turgidum subsp. durum TaxID=4567 RepID=A0A9R1S7J1_TRITD|nr:unnamed protein product [Triticum turgidum subsp. durum]